MALSTASKLSAARLWARKQVPYLGTALVSLIYREVKDGSLPSSGGTFAMTDRGVLMYEPRAVERWTVQEIGSVIIHELFHFLRKHGARCGARDPMLWNLAGDAAINDDLHAMKLPLPDGGGFVPSSIARGTPDGRTEEEYYQLLVQQVTPPPPGGVGHGTCGSCAGKPSGGSGDADEGEADPGRSPGEQQVIRLQTAQAVKQHAQAHGIGSVPSDLLRWADEFVQPPKVRWEDKLQQVGLGAIDNARGHADTTYQRISIRQAGLGFGAGRPVLAAPRGRKSRVWCAVDTSGSMGQSEINRAVAEIVALVEACGGELVLLACDCAVGAINTVTCLEEIKASLTGGGGTAFTPVFEAITERDEDIDLLVFVTDGGGYAPLTGPEDYEVIWLLVGKHRCKPYAEGGGHVEYGDFIEVDD